MNESMDNDQMPDRDVEDVEITRRLEAYAEARLSPSLSATMRMRAQVMAAAQRQAAGRRVVVRGFRWQRPVAALLAACLTLALVVGSVAAARPGGPLYGARIWAETLTLPASAADRAAAEVRRLNERLSEAADATAAGDTHAADAALAAYNAIVAEATAGTTGDAIANATLNTAVRRNIAVLTILAGRVPEQARDAIEHAIQQSDSAVDRLRGRPGVGGEPSNPGNAPGATNRSEHTANPNKPAPAPFDATPKPKPHVTPEPAAATPAPEHTPKAIGKPSSPPGGGNQGG